VINEQPSLEAGSVVAADDVTILLTGVDGS